jgi:hypothetical protein
MATFRSTRQKQELAVKAAVRARVTEIKRGSRSWFVERDYKLWDFVHIPEWLSHNPSIRSAYRVHLSMSQTIRSLFHLHNGTQTTTTEILLPNRE